MRQSTVATLLSFIALCCVTSNVLGTNIGKTDFCGVTTDGGATVDSQIQSLVTLYVYPCLCVGPDDADLTAKC